MKNIFITLIAIFFAFTDLKAKIITSSDSAEIITPQIYQNIIENEVLYEIEPKCSVSEVILSVRTSSMKYDTLAILQKPPFNAVWNSSQKSQLDQLHLQFQYVLIHINGDTIISPATPHRWLRFSSVQTNKNRCVSRYLDPKEEITIDGDLSDWKKVPANTISSNAYFKTRWSSSDFYFAVVVQDEKITPQDQIEISLDLLPDESPFFGINQRIFIFGPSRRSFVIAVDRKEKEPIQSDSILIRVGEEMEWRSKNNQDEYTIEIRIPFVLLSDLEFPPKTFGFDITVKDYNNSNIDIRSWSAKFPASRQIKLNWGTILLKQNYFPLKLTLLIGLFIFIILIILSSLIGIINKHVSKRKIKKIELSKIATKILQSINQHANDQSISIERISKMINMSTDEIEETLLQEMDSNFISVLATKRVEKSKKELLNTDNSIETISTNCGFNDPKEFILAFENIMKTDPQTWREGREIDDEEDEEFEESNY